MRQKNKKIFVISILMIFICSLIPLSQIQPVNATIYLKEGFTESNTDNTSGYIYNSDFDASNSYLINCSNMDIDFSGTGTANFTVFLRYNNYASSHNSLHISFDTIYVDSVPTQYNIRVGNRYLDLWQYVLFDYGSSTLDVPVYLTFFSDHVLAYADGYYTNFYFPADGFNGINDKGFQSLTASIVQYTTSSFYIESSPIIEDNYYDIEFTSECWTNGVTYFRLMDSYDNIIVNKQEVNSTHNTLSVFTNSVLTVYGIANEGYIFNETIIDFTSESDLGDYYSGYSFEVIDDCEITVIFSEWTEEFENEVYLAVSNPTDDGLIQVQYNGDEYWVESFQNFTVPYNTEYYVRYFPQYNVFTNWWFQVYYMSEGIESQYNTTMTENPIIQSTGYDGTDNRDLTLFFVANSVFSGGATPTPTPTATTPTPTSTTEETWDKINSIFEFLFGDEGLLGEGFGIVILLIALFVAVFIPQTRNLWGIMVFMTIAFIINLATGLWEIWTIIILFMMWLALILNQSGVLSRSDSGE